jgi:Zn-dependent protease with chaperone function
VDNSATDALSWSTPAAMGAVMVVGGLLLGGAAVFSSPDPAGLVLMSIAALLLVVLGAIALWVRPKLAVIDGRLLQIRTVTGVRRYPFDEVRQAQLITYARYGRQVPHLEFDLADADAHDGERLVIFGRWDLGANPLDVADALRTAGLPVQERT